MLSYNSSMQVHSRSVVMGSRNERICGLWAHYKSVSFYSVSRQNEQTEARAQLAQMRRDSRQNMDRDAKQCAGQSRRGATGIHIPACDKSILSGVSQRCCRSGGYGSPRASRNSRTVMASPAQKDTNDTVGMRPPSPLSSTGCRHPLQGLPGV